MINPIIMEKSVLKVGVVSFDPELTRQVLRSQDVSEWNLWANLTDRGYELVITEELATSSEVSSYRIVAHQIRELPAVGAQAMMFT